MMYLEIFVTMFVVLTTSGLVQSNEGKTAINTTSSTTTPWHLPTRCIGKLNLSEYKSTFWVHFWQKRKTLIKTLSKHLVKHASLSTISKEAGRDKRISWTQRVFANVVGYKCSIHVHRVCNFGPGLHNIRHSSLVCCHGLAVLQFQLQFARLCFHNIRMGEGRVRTN